MWQEYRRKVSQTSPVPLGQARVTASGTQTGPLCPGDMQYLRDIFQLILFLLRSFAARISGINVSRIRPVEIRNSTCVGR